MIFRGPRASVPTETTIHYKAPDLYEHDYNSSSYLMIRNSDSQQGYISEGIFATTGSNTFTGNQIISGNLEVTGTTISKNGFIYQTKEITTEVYSASFNYQYYGVTYTGGICTITLPDTVSPQDDGKFLSIADETGSISYGNRGIRVQGSNGQLINGHDNILMKIDQMSLTFLFRNNSWKTI